MTKINKKQTLTISLDIFLISLILIGQKFYEKLMELLPECVILTFTGRQCGSCGGTRCVYNFFTGNFVSAFQLNPFFFFATIYAIIVILLVNLAFLFMIKNFEKPLKAIANYKVIIAWAIAYSVFTVIRIF